MQNVSRTFKLNTKKMNNLIKNGKKQGTDTSPKNYTSDKLAYENMLSILHVRELWIKTMRYQYIPISMARIQTIHNSKCWQECGALGTLNHCVGNAKSYSYIER